MMDPADPWILKTSYIDITRFSFTVVVNGYAVPDPDRGRSATSAGWLGARLRALGGATMRRIGPTGARDYPVAPGPSLA